MTAGAANSVIPYVENDSTATTTINIANPNSGAASVTISIFDSTGKAAGSTVVSVAANGFASAMTPGSVGGGYVTLASRQPVVAFGVVAPTSGTDFAAIAAQPVASVPSGSGGGNGGPQISAGGVVNAADYTPKVTRGSLVFAFGTNLASPPTAAAKSIPLPLSQNGASVTAAGISAPVFVTDPSFIEFQMPYEVPLGQVPVVVSFNGNPSNTVEVTVADYAFGIFQYNRTPTIVDPDIFHLNGTVVTPNSPAVPQETVIVIANGIGKLNSPPKTNAPVSAPYPTAVDTPVVTVGGVAGVSQYAGLLAGDLAVVQMNASGFPRTCQGGTLPVVIQFPGDSSPPVNLYVAGNGTAAPKIGVTPSSLSFGNVTLATTSSAMLSISNTGTTALTVNSITSSNGMFAATNPATPFTVQPGASITVTVVFSPTSAGGQSGNLTISSNDPASPQFTVGVSGTGTPAAAPSITTSPATLTFGSVTVGKPQSLPLTINNVGTATLSVSAITIDNKLFAPATASVSVAAGASFNLSVQFAPGGRRPWQNVDAGDQRSRACDRNGRSDGNGRGGDLEHGHALGGWRCVRQRGWISGIADRGVREPADATVVSGDPDRDRDLLRRPFHGPSGRLDHRAGRGHQPQWLAGHLVGDDRCSRTLYTAGITALGAFNTYTLPTPITVTSGDFVVGFNVVDPQGIFPADEDQANKSQGRSYVSTDGNTFTVVDSFGATVAGNFGIRALVTVGGSQ